MLCVISAGHVARSWAHQVLCCDVESVNADKEAGSSEADILERCLSDKSGPYHFPPLEYQAVEASHR
jgi:hypothetical protein